LDKIAAEAEITQDVDAVGSESASVKGSESASVKGSEKLAPARVVAAHQYAVTLQEVDRLKEILSKVRFSSCWAFITHLSLSRNKKRIIY
jgi:hypothetical protein